MRNGDCSFFYGSALCIFCSSIIVGTTAYTYAAAAASATEHALSVVCGLQDEKDKKKKENKILISCVNQGKRDSCDIKGIIMLAYSSCFICLTLP